MRRAFGSISLCLVLAACAGGGGDGAPTTGSIVLTVSAPAGVPAAITVTGGGGFSQAVTTSTTLSNLRPGTYYITAANSIVSNSTYAPDQTSIAVSVSASQTPAQASIAYSLASGSLAISASGLPGGVSPSVAVTGPNGFSQTVTSSQTLFNLAPGSYTVAANIVTVVGTTYGGTPQSQTVAVPISLTAAPANVVYSAMTGKLTVTVGGSMAGLSPSVLITGPLGFSLAITTPGTSSVDLLPLGSYHIATTDVSNATEIYRGANQDVMINSGALNQSATVTYALATGSISFVVKGLPAGVDAHVRLMNEQDSSVHIITKTTTIYKLAPGDYDIFAFGVTAGGLVYAPTSTIESALVHASLVPEPGGTHDYGALDLTVAAVSISQATQSVSDTVPLVANRDGYVRVFVNTNQSTFVAPNVRLRWYQGATLVRTDTVLYPPGWAFGSSESAPFSTWNLRVPASLLTPGLSVLADVDPANTIYETSKTNNIFPTSGVPRPIDIRTPSVFHEMLVPVFTKKDGRQGLVEPDKLDDWLKFTMRVHPITSYTVAMHAVYTALDTVDVLQPDDANGLWGTVLEEITALRTAEDVTPLLDSTYYYGVVQPGYGGGVAGLGWIGYPAAIGWDRGENDFVLAHETGHNWGRLHSPGCGAAGADPTYPNSTGHIDSFGRDVAADTTIDPAFAYDLMSYCGPAWTSNFTWIGVLNYRAASPDMASAGMRGSLPEPVLLVWGRIVAGKLVLEPGFEITARAHLPEGHGAYTIEGIDAGGSPLFSYAFEALEMADARTPSRGFAFAIPLARFDASRLASLRLAGGGREARVNGGQVVAALRYGNTPAAAVAAKRRSGRSTRVSWDGAQYPMAMIRDGRTGQVLSFARGGGATLDVAGSELEVVLSDGVRSVTKRVGIQ